MRIINYLSILTTPLYNTLNFILYHLKNATSLIQNNITTILTSLLILLTLFLLFKSTCNNSPAIKTAQNYSKKITNIQKRTALELQKNITDSEKEIKHSIKQKEVEELKQELEEEFK